MPLVALFLPCISDAASLNDFYATDAAAVAMMMPAQSRGPWLFMALAAMVCSNMKAGG